MCPESRLVAFTVARQKDFIPTAKPITGCKAEGYKANFQAHAYRLKEIGHMPGVLGEPARTAGQWDGLRRLQPFHFGIRIWAEVNEPDETQRV
jgi:hypothetical protein